MVSVKLRRLVVAGSRNDSIAALSPHAPTLPIEPRSLSRFSALRKRRDRNWDPLVVVKLMQHRDELLLLGLTG